MQHKAACVSHKSQLGEIDGELIGLCALIYKLPLHSDLHTQRGLCETRYLLSNKNR